MAYFETSIFYPSPAAADAFGRFRISENFNLFESKQLMDNGTPIFWSHYSTPLSATSFTYTQSAASTTIFAANSGSHGIRQTKRVFNYQSGKSQQVFITGTLAGQANTIKRIGYFNLVNDNSPIVKDGIYFEQNGTTTAVGVSKNGTVVYYATQSQWKLDTLNSATLNPSGKQLNMNYSQIFAFDFEWLGVGKIRFGLVINGELIYVDTYNNSNERAGVTFSNPNLPLTYQLYTTANAVSGTMEAICASVQTEGGFQLLGRAVTVSNGSTAVASGANGAFTNANILVRWQTGKEISIVAPSSTSIINTTGNQNIRFLITINPTISNSPTWVPIAGTSLEYAVNGTVSDVGTILSDEYISSTSDSTSLDLSNNPIKLGKSLNGTRDVFCFIGTSLGASQNLLCAVNLNEIV